MKPVKFLILSLLAACGGGGSSGDGDITLPDASTPPTPDAPPASCLLAASLGTVTPANSFAEWSPGMADPAPESYVFGAAMNADPMPDVLFIELYKGFGVFTNGFPATAEVQLTGAEAAYDSCGACVLAYTDFTMQGPTGDPYLATAGTVNFTSISQTSLAGTLTNVTFQHVTINSETFASTPHADGCSSTLTSVEFTAVPEMAMQALQAGRVRYRLQLRRPTR